MVRKSLFPILIIILILAGCPVGNTGVASPIKITQIDGTPGVVYVNETIRLEAAPVGPLDTVEWTVQDGQHDAADPESSCALLVSSGVIEGRSSCEYISIVAKSSTGAVATYSLIVDDSNIKKPPIEK